MVSVGHNVRSYVCADLLSTREGSPSKGGVHLHPLYPPLDPPLDHRKTWAYIPDEYGLGHCGFSAASRHKRAFTRRHYALLTATDTTALY